MRNMFASVLLAATMLASSTQAQEPDASAQKRAWAKCRVCHAIEKDVHRQEGPSLFGVLGAKAAEQPGFTYSSALKNSGLVWSEETMDKFLQKPTAVVPGNMMPFPGMPRAEERAAVIAYMKANGGVH